MGKVDIAGTIRTLATLVRLHEGNLDAEVNALLERAETCANVAVYLTAALSDIATVGDGYERHSPPRYYAGTTGEGHAKCRQIATDALATLTGAA